MKYFIQAKQDSASVINLIHAERQALESFSKLVISLLRNVQLSSEFKIEIILNCIQETQQFASSLSMTSPVLLLFGNLLDRNKNHEEHLDNVMATFDLTRDLIKKSFSFLNILEASVRSAKELSYKNNKSSKNDVLLTNLSSL
jgi:hypothetical protein